MAFPTRVTPSGAVISEDTDARAQFNAAAYEQYGIHANAEEMIEAHRRSINPALQKASLIQVDAEATEEAKSDLKAAGKKLGLRDGQTLIDVTVRGNAVIGVVEEEDGYVHKAVAGWTDDWVPPVLTPDQAAAQAQADQESLIRHEVDKLKAEYQGDLNDAITDLTTNFNEQLAKIRADAAKEVEKAQAKAEREADRASSSSSRSSGGRKKSASRRKSGSRRKTGSSKKTSTSSTQSSGPAAGGVVDASAVRTPQEKKGESSGA